MRRYRDLSILLVAFLYLKSSFAYGGLTSPLLVTQHAKLIPANPSANDSFGVSVAVSGDTAVIGAYRDDIPGAGNVGSAYVYVRAGMEWIEQKRLTASDATVDDGFGISVAISGDTIIVGAVGHNSEGSDLPGSAYVFVRNGSNWTEQAKLVHSNPQPGDRYGDAVAISGDIAVIGAYRDDNAGGVDAGCAYVFTRNGGDWTQQAKLMASGAAPEDFFGNSVAVSGDAVAVGAHSYGPTSSIPNTGAIYVFVRSGTRWSQQARLTANDATSNDTLGTSVTISGDIVVAGALGDEHNVGHASGSAYVFVRTGTIWMQQAKLIALDTAPADRFGIAVSISNDRALIGASGKNSAAGSTYIFRRNGSNWSQVAQINAADAASSREFGDSVCASGDTWIVGTRPGGSSDYAAYIFVEALRAADCCRGDLDQSGAVDGLDIQPFVDKLLSGGECP